MIKTKHFINRLQQRGISQTDINLVYEYGEYRGDFISLSKKKLKKLLCWKNRPHYKELNRLLTKGGCTIVQEGDDLITAYYNTRKHYHLYAA